MACQGSFDRDCDVWDHVHSLVRKIPLHISSPSTLTRSYLALTPMTFLFLSLHFARRQHALTKRERIPSAWPPSRQLAAWTPHLPPWVNRMFHLTRCAPDQRGELSWLQGLLAPHSLFRLLTPPSCPMPTRKNTVIDWPVDHTLPPPHRSLDDTHFTLDARISEGLFVQLYAQGHR
jgi:hypothetical protein